MKEPEIAKLGTDVFVQTNFLDLSVQTIRRLKQLVGKFMAYAQGRQLTKSVDMKTKLDNVES